MRLAHCLPLLAVSLFASVIFTGCASSEDEEEGAGEAASEVKSAAPVTGKQEVGKVFKVTADGLRLRKEPKIVSGNILEILTSGTRVKLVAAAPTGSFYNVEVIDSKKKGWVDGGYLIAEKSEVAQAPVGSCAALSTCCADLKKAGFDDSECKRTVSAGNDAACVSTHQRHGSMGDCRAPSTSASSVSGACSALSTCCADLKKAGFDDSECKRVTTAGNDATCQSTHQRHASMGDCKAPSATSSTIASGGTAPAGACAALSTCCGDLQKAGFSDAECRSVVSKADSASCLSTHQRHADMGDCLRP